MVRIKLHRESRKQNAEKTAKDQFLFPVGKIDQITIYPMTFGEFLLNNNSLLYSKVRESYDSKQALSTEIHNLALNEVYKYLLIGGMPEAVEAYIERKDLLETREILRSLYDNYLADMELYQASSESILRSRLLFENIFRELNKESKNFSAGLIKKDSRTRDFATSIQWLLMTCLLYTSPSPRDRQKSRMPSSA